MAVLRSVAKTDTFEIQRQKINLIAQDVYDFTSGESSITVLKTEYADGSLVSPSFTFETDVTLGIYKDGAQRLGFASGGKPVLSLSPTGSYFAQNLYTEKRSLSTQNITITSGGTGYAEGVYTNINVLGGTGTAAKATITVDSNGSVSDVVITDGGYSYVVGDDLTVAPQEISNDPTGRVVGLTLINGGQTYVSGLDVPTTGGSGTGLTVDITASVNGVPEQIGFLNGTEGYVTTQNVSTTGGLGSGLTLDIVASTGGIIGTVENIISGSNYFDGVYSPTGGNGTGASVSISVINAGEINQLSLTSVGSGYTTSTTTLSGGFGNGATVDIVAGPQNVVSAFTVDSVGSVYTPGTYTNQPTSPINVTSTGVGLTVNFVVDAGGTLSNITLNSGGSGYVQGETVSIPGSQALDPETGLPAPDDARLSISSVTPGGAISSVIINSGGIEYQVNDILTIDGGTGGTVTVTSILGGSITGINIVNGGQNYQIGDVLTIPNGTGGQFTVSGVTGGEITSASINTPGSGYSINDLITIGNGTATVVVTDISGGNITNIQVNDPGTGYGVGDVITVSGVNNTPDQATYTIVDTSDGSGFSFTSTGISVTSPVKVEVLTGDVEAVSFTGQLGFIDDINSDFITTDNLTASTNISTPKLSASNILEFDVVNDINIGTNRVNIFDNSNTITLSIESSNGNITTNGEVKCLDGLNVNDITTIVDNTISSLLENPLILKPFPGKNIKIDSNRALIVPVGTQVQRPQLDAETGAIRFNTDTRQFEGYDGDTNVWSSLGSVRDTDGNTFLLAEATVGANDNIFYFYNNNSNTLKITTTDLVFESINSLVSTNGSLVVKNTSLSIDQNLTFSPNLIETRLSGLTIKPSTGTNVVVDAQTSLVIPTGSTGQRGSATTGAIRFNTSNQQFEGYGLNAWSSLGGVRDVDGNTYIIPELSAGSNENILYFYNNGVNTLQLDQDKLEFRSANTISSIDLVGVLKWEPATTYEQDDLVHNGTNVYKITTNLTSGGSGPTHTSGTTNNYEYIRTIYGNLTFTNINNVNINSVLNVNNKLKIINSDISSVTEDITITPFSGKLVKVNSTTSFVLPVGNNLNRGIAEAGAVRFNTATTQYEGYNGTAWTSLGGVRDVDGNTYIIPESSSGANENILYFYNDGDNTLRVTKTSLTFQTANTITSNNNILNINVDGVRYSSDTFGIDSTSSTITKLYSGKNNLDIGLKSGLTNDALLRLSATGDIYVNKTFTEGSYTGEKVLDRTLTYFGLANAVLETNKFTLVKDTTNFNSYVLYDPNLASACKLTIIAVDLSTYEKHMVDYNIIANGANIYNIEYESLLSGNLLYDATFDFDSNGDVRLTTTLDSSVSSGSSIEFTILKTFIR
jgi:hypothetical protein